MTLFFAGQIVTDAELNSGSAQVDTTAFSGTPTTLTQFSKLWDIAANTAQGGSSWRLTVLGKSVMGTTSVGLNYYIGFGPSGATQIEIVQMAAGDQPISTTWWFMTIIHMVVNQGGSTGNASVFGTASASIVTSTSSLTWTNGATAQSFNTTVDNKLCMIFSYTASTGTPVVTTYGSILERTS